MARILLVDDDTNVLVTTDVLLSAYGHEVTNAGDGDKALKCLEKGPYDLVLSDFNMPGMNGLELFKKVRTDRRFSNMPFLILSGNPDLRLACEREGAVFCVKPPPDLVKIVNITLGSK